MVFVAQLEEASQLRVVVYLEGVAGAYAVVRLDHHRIAYHVHKGLGVIPLLHQMVAGGRDACLGIVLLHLGLVLDAWDVLIMEAAVDVEVGAQMGITLQPVFVVGFQPVDAAVLADEEGNRLVYLVVVFQAADLVILVQAVLQLLPEVIIRAVADAQHPEAVVLQLAAEIPVVFREIRGKKYHIFHYISPHKILYAVYDWA